MNSKVRCHLAKSTESFQESGLLRRDVILQWHRGGEPGTVKCDVKITDRRPRLQYVLALKMPNSVIRFRLN